MSSSLAELRAFEGNYEFKDGRGASEIRLEGKSLSYVTPGQVVKFSLVAVGTNRFKFLDWKGEIEFFAVDGKVVRMAAWDGETPNVLLRTSDQQRQQCLLWHDADISTGSE